MGNVIVSNITRVATDEGGGIWGSTGNTPPAGAATLTNAAESLGSTSASIKCTSDSVVGTLYYYVSLSGTAPSITDLKAGTGAFKFGNTASVLASINSFNVTGLTAEANYYSYFVQNNGSDSNVLPSGIWTTLSEAGDPAITNVTGTVTEGSTLTLAGTSFGVGGPALVYDTVENQPAYDGLVDGDEILYSPAVPAAPWEDHPYNYDDVFMATTGGPTGSSEHYKSGVGGTSFVSWATAQDGTTQRELYVNWRYKPSVGPYSNGGSNKHIRIWDAESGLKTRISWTSMHMTYGPQGAGKTSWGAWSGNDNAWNLMEIWANASTGRIVARTNGLTKHDVSDFVEFSTTEGLKVKLIGFDTSISSYYPTMITELDNIVVQPTRARVELSDSATYDLTSTREIQEVGTWTGGNAITLNLRKGEVSSLSGAYLYVIDANGNVNTSGYQI